jgi:hypothetical protein
MVKLVTGLALATLALSPAFAAKYAAHPAAKPTDAYAYAAQDPDAVVVDGQVVGRDPDANVRLSLRRDPWLQAN